MNTPTVPGGAPNSPYGTTAASWKLVATAGAGFHVWRNAVTFTAADYTFSFWAKAAEYDRIVLSDVGTGRGACSFVLTGNGTATAIAGSVTPTNPTIVKHDNGWYRCSVTMTMTAATYGIGIVGYPAATTPTAFGASYTADGTSGVYATMFQTELGSGASSYIPTGASTGTRNADSCDCTSGNFSSWYTQGPGTLLVHARPFRQNYSDLASLCTSTSDPRLAIRTNDPPSAAGITLYGNNSGTVINIKTANSYSINNLLKTAVGLQQGNYAVVLNGGTVNSSVGTGTFPTALNRLTIGQPAAGGSEANAWISLIKYWPTRLPDAQLQSLTT
jgi:hypothetical protein